MPNAKGDTLSVREMPDRTGRSTYRIEVPAGWIRQETPASIRYYVPGRRIHSFRGCEGGVHTFPPGIPPTAQINRWQRQAAGGAVRPGAHGGYAGLCLDHPALIAWAMQLDPRFGGVVDDYTIKATGELAPHRDEVHQFARSFEIIREL